MVPIVGRILGPATDTCRDEPVDPLDDLRPHRSMPGFMPTSSHLSSPSIFPSDASGSLRRAGSPSPMALGSPGFSRDTSL